ncbi:MAG TPA: hypothetical protein VK651_08710, partial [Blastocatellia bacterium]|nr:hypothetical protein [Blastocatellia bacterium]
MTDDKRGSGVPEVPRGKLRNPVASRNCRTLVKEPRSGPTLSELALLRSVPEMNQRQISVWPTRANLGSLPEFVVLSAPTYERFVKT